MNIDQYFLKLEEQVNKNYLIAGVARKIGVDPSSVVDVPIARSLAERVLGLVSVLYPQIQNPKIVERILELEKQYGSLNPAVALTIAEEIAKERYCTFKDKLQAMEAGIRAALGYLTLGYVSSPIEGFIQLKVCKRADGKEYLAPYYSGPIRSAGGTEAAFSLVVIDYLREMFGYEKYDPTEDEIKRGIHECYEYHDKITNLQYLPSEQEIEFLMRYLPIQLTGDPSEDREVLNYKDLPRIETNMLRSGFCLVLGEGLAQKAPKILARVIKLREKGFKLTDWPFLDEFVKLQKKIKEGKTGGNRGGATYIQDLVAGRPVYAHPSRSGAFRLRYGRARNTGYSTLALSPATMGASDGSIAIGTQLKIEQPTKGCTVASCDSIDGPIVKFRDGSVRRILTYEEGRTQYKDIEEIIYLGDLLVPYGDFLNRNHALEKPGYVEQYWLEELIKKGGESSLQVSFEKALELSKQFGVSLHPSYIYYWREIEKEAFLSLVDWVAHGRISEEKLILPYTAQDRQRFAKGKRALEIIGCNHIVAIEDVVLDSTNSNAFLFNLGIDIENFKKEIEESILKIKGSAQEKVLDILKEVSKVEIRDKSGTFIGARMGRPEKAKLRKLTGSPHVLFPVGEEGGRLRSFQEAIENGKVVSEFPIYYCAACKRETIYSQCENCKGKCEKKSYCHKCQKTMDGKCEEHQIQSDYKEMDLDINHYFNDALKKIGIRLEEIPVVVKGVRGTSSADHSCEYLAKGLLRAKHNLNVNKDGTIRYDMTEMPITQFKPKEIGTKVEKLRELGYEKDIYGKELENEEQILEIFPHDIILPSCPETPDEKADDVLLNVSKFVDDELEKIYGQPRHFNATNSQDLIGSLLGCMSPHTSAVALGRLIGFSNIQAMLCSPYVHAAMRRDCDGDEAAIMFLMDLLLNFSRKFIPSHRGGTQDAPLVLNIKIKANEVDDMIFDLDVGTKIPLELYEAAELHKMPGEIKMPQIKGRLGTGNEFTNIGYSYEVGDLNSGALCSTYKTLPTMQDKLDMMMKLCEKIRAVDIEDVARLVVERHFIRDTRGNLRKFSMQEFRCVGCNSKYRRPPLTGKCKCGGRLIFTIAEGSVLKYMQPALNLVRKYGSSAYLLESLELNEMYIQSIFGKEKEKQMTLL